MIHWRLVLKLCFKNGADYKLSWNFPFSQEWLSSVETLLLLNANDFTNVTSDYQVVLCNPLAFTFNS